MPRIELPWGDKLPVLGQGTWHLGEGRRPAEEEIAALRLGVELGMNLIDTAEMYGNGRSEELVGKAIGGQRDAVFLVSKILPWHASQRGTRAACRASLDRLKTDRLDLYLLHWPGSEPLGKTIEAFAQLQEAGTIGNWGVSNFGLRDLQRLDALTHGWSVATDQVLYNPLHRGIELDVLPWCRQHGLPVMAYSPIEQGRLLRHPVLVEIAERHGGTPAQVVLAWIVRQDGLCAIPEAGSARHVQENRGSLDIPLTGQDYAELNHAFPAPRLPIPLEVI